MINYSIRRINNTDRDWIARFTEEHWASDRMATRGRVFYISQQEGFVAQVEGAEGVQLAGLVTYHIENAACEITSLDSLREGLGIGTALIQAVQEEAARAGCHRLFLITTNDNVDALRFYQHRGFVLAALYRDAVTEARRALKPQIPLTGNYGIPIRDELELEIRL